MMKYAVCNELFGEMSLADSFAMVRRAGYTGVEFAPFTIFGDFSVASIKRGVAEARRALDGEGLAFVGFHWLMAKPDGLHFASLEAGARRAALDHLARLVEAAGELGGGILVLGSPRQRGSFPGRSREEATQCLREALKAITPRVKAAGCKFLLEQLSPEQTDVVTTMAEAAAIVDGLGDPSMRSMFDFRNAASETEPWDTLLEKYHRYIEHVHINEVDGRAPGTGSSDYLPAFRSLALHGYKGWVSMEIFEVPGDPEATISRARQLFSQWEGEVAKNTASGGTR